MLTHFKTNQEMRKGSLRILLGNSLFLIRRMWLLIKELSMERRRREKSLCLSAKYLCTLKMPSPNPIVSKIPFKPNPSTTSAKALLSKSTPIKPSQKDSSRKLLHIRHLAAFPRQVLRPYLQRCSRQRVNNCRLRSFSGIRVREKD